MIWVAAFIVITLALLAASSIMRRHEHAVAFSVVLAGLIVMAVFRSEANGVVAFAVWTMASYLLLNFPVAATLYLASAFCYTLQLSGHLNVALQVASNAAGLLGLVAIWNGTPRWRYSDRGYSGPGRFVALARNAFGGGQVYKVNQKDGPR